MISRSVAVTFVIVSALALWAQDPSKSTDRHAGATIEEVLEFHHIVPTRAGLEEALRNSDPEVRSLVAQKLAQDNYKESLPALSEALAIEKIPQTRVNIAYAVAKLGDDKGVTALDSICADSSVGAFVKSEAARLLLYVAKSSPGCLTAMIDVLGHADISTRMNAAWLLPKFHDLSAEDSDRVFQSLVKELKAEDASLRQVVSRALADLGNRSAVPYLQSALAIEQDASVRTQMESSLRRLQPKAD